MILILEEISNRIIGNLSLDRDPPLCDYLDMIVGVGVGGCVINHAVKRMLMELIDTSHFCSVVWG
jgi:hypothetical protein